MSEEYDEVTPALWELWIRYVAGVPLEDLETATTEEKLVALANWLDELDTIAQPPELNGENVSDFLLELAERLARLEVLETDMRAALAQHYRTGDYSPLGVAAQDALLRLDEDA